MVQKLPSAQKYCPVCKKRFSRESVCPVDGILLSADDPLIGTTFDNRYEILEYLGQGGMSLVYKAKQSGLERAVAIKFMKPHLCNDPLTVKRFRREAQAVSQLQHSHIASLYAFGISDDGRPYLAMEYLEGKTLAQVLDREKPLRLDRAIQFFIEIASACAHSHAHGIIHRDLKPSNIVIVENEDGGESVKVVDFGSSIMLFGHGLDGQRLTRDGEVFGTLEYMSPEQMQGKEIGPRSDIYSFGKLMYECVVSEMKVPAELNPIITRCLKESPDDRYESMAEVVADLGKAALASREPSKKIDVVHCDPTAERKRLKPIALAAIAVCLAVFLCLAFSPTSIAPLVVACCTNASAQTLEQCGDTFAQLKRNSGADLCYWEAFKKSGQDNPDIQAHLLVKLANLRIADPAVVADAKVGLFTRIIAELRESGGRQAVAKKQAAALTQIIKDSSWQSLHMDNRKMADALYQLKCAGAFNETLGVAKQWALSSRAALAYSVWVDLLLTSDNLEEAKQASEAWLQSSLRDSDEEQAAMALSRLAEICVGLKDFKSAKKYTLQGERIGSSMAVRLSQAKYRATIFLHEGNRTEAQNVVLKALKTGEDHIRENDGFGDSRVLFYKTLGSIYSLAATTYFPDAPKAQREAYLHRSNQCFEKVMQAEISPGFRGICMRDIATNWQYLENEDMAIECLNQAAELLAGEGLHGESAVAYAGMSDILFNQGQYTRARKRLELARKECDISQNSHDVESLPYVARMFSSRFHDNDSADALYERAVEMKKAFKFSPHSITRTMLEQADRKIILKQFAQAKAIARNALDVLADQKISSERLIAYRQLATCSIVDGDFKQAEQYLKLANAEQTESVLQKGMLLFATANLTSRQGNKAEALKLYRESADKLMLTTSPSDRADAIEPLTRIANFCNRHGDTAKAQQIDAYLKK